MACRAFLAAIFGTLLLVGCSTHPIPADRIGLSVYDIAHKIRCEAREVIYAKAFDGPQQKRLFEAFTVEEKKLGQRINTEKTRFAARLPQLNAEREVLAKQEQLIAAKIAELVNRLRPWADAVLSDEARPSGYDIADAGHDFAELQKWVESRKKNQGQIREFNSRLSLFERDRLYALQEIARARSVFNFRFAEPLKFLGNTFAYSLRFQIEETNDLRINTADFTQAITLGTITIGIGAGDKKQRKGQREVRVAASFKDLLALEKECAEGMYFMDEGSFHLLQYPIRGRIGLDEVITQYLNILDGEFALADTASSGKTYSSIITFTTTVDGSIKPSASITQRSGDRFSGNGLLSGQRQDIHEATIVIVPPPKPGSVEPDKTVNVRLVNSSSLLQD